MAFECLAGKFVTAQGCLRAGVAEQSLNLGQRDALVEPHSADGAAQRVRTDGPGGIRRLGGRCDVAVQGSAVRAGVAAGAQQGPGAAAVDSGLDCAAAPQLLVGVPNSPRVVVQALAGFGEVDAEAVDRLGHAEVLSRHHDNTHVVPVGDADATRLGGSPVGGRRHREVHGSSLAARCDITGAEGVDLSVGVASVSAMKVFISSVTYALKAERDALAAQLKVVLPYEPLRFEDFTAQGRSSREACLAGVEACDVYVLLLGPRYGDSLPDTGMAPTEEEFEHARRLGKQILAFVKDIDEEDEPRQAAFKTRVQSYVNGYFRGSFVDPLSLNLAVTAALAGVSLGPAALEWTTLPEPADLVWRWSVPAVKDSGLYGPVLDVHLVPVGAQPLRATQLQALPASLTRAARDVGFFTETDAVQAASDSAMAWSWVPNQRGGGAGSYLNDRQEHTHRGLLAHRSGQVTVFEALTTDSMGALVNREELQRRLARLMSLAAGALPAGTTVVAPAASLSPLDRVFEGDPSKVGGRHQGTMRMTSAAAAVMNPTATVSVRAVIDHSGDVAAELAAEVLDGLRQTR